MRRISTNGLFGGMSIEDDSSTWRQSEEIRYKVTYVQVGKDSWVKSEDISAVYPKEDSETTVIVLSNGVKLESSVSPRELMERMAKPRG